MPWHGLLARLDTEPDKAMEALVEQYAALVCHVASKYLAGPEDVRECVNDVFTEVYLHRLEYSPEKGSLASWIGTIARNRAISRYRKQRKDQPLPEDGAVLDCSAASGSGSIPRGASEFSSEGDRICWLTGKSLSAFSRGQRQELSLHLSYIRCGGETYDDITVPFALIPAEPEELDDAALKNRNFGRVEYYPSDGQFDPICIFCEGPLELKFEVTP